MKRSEYMAGYEAGYMNGQHKPDDVAEEAIRADERAKCRAELRDKLEALTMDGYRDSDDRWIAVWDWARTEAFGGE